MLTVYGIETQNNLYQLYLQFQLQQCLLFTVLKLIFMNVFHNTHSNNVATVLTVYGIDT